MKLSTEQFAPRKSLGQHFLHQQQVISRMIDAVSPRKGEQILEIGPGLGALTGPLLEAGVELLAVELDRRLVSLLHKKFASYPNLKLINNDILRFLGTPSPLRGTVPWRVVGNLPYNIASPLIFNLTDGSHPISELFLMVQQEVAQRLLASSGSRAYGRGSVKLSFCCSERNKLFNVAAGAFSPPPAVNSQVIQLLTRQPPPDPDFLKRLEQVARICFSQRRKTLRRSLGQLRQNDWEALSIDPGLRPQQLNEADFARLADYSLCLADTA